MRVFREYPNDVVWNLPLFLNNDRVCRDLHNSSKILFGRSPVTDVFGGFRSVWSGGRGSTLSLDDMPIIYRNLSWCAHEGIRCWFTFSRHSVSPDDLKNPDMLSFLEFMASTDFPVGFIVSDDGLLDVIKSYGSWPVKLSVVRASFEFNGNGDYEKESGFYHRAIERGYDLIVPRCEFVKERPGLLSDIADRCEVIVNQLCVPNCPAMLRHYEVMERFESSGEFTDFVCRSRPTFLDVLRNDIIDYDGICVLSGMGFRRFKLQGRGLTARCVLEYVSDYIYEPTGPIRVLVEEIVKRVNLDLASGVDGRY